MTNIGWKMDSSLPLVQWFVCIQILLIVGSTQAGREFQRQASQQRRLQPYTDNTNDVPQHSPPVKSFLVSDGSWIDCIPIEGQIAAHHQTLQEHNIQMGPSTQARRSCHAPGTSQLHPQLFAREHGSCPQGSIPVQRIDPDRPSLKKSRIPTVSTSIAGPGAAPGETHEYAVTGLPQSAQSYSGAYAFFSVNGPVLEAPQQDFSLSQVWIIDGHWNDGTLSTIEVGWQTYPLLHPNDKPLAPHLFIFWTNNAYNYSGCYNLECPGFVQYDSKWVIGGAMPYYTTLGENRKRELEVEIEVLYDPTQLSWWLYVNNDPVGYWPASIFDGRLRGSANLVQWGGEIVFFKRGNGISHSKTGMGSGAFPVGGYPVAAYQRNISFADASGDYYDAKPSVLKQQRILNDPHCYNITIQQGNFRNWGTYFFFGGSGGNNSGCAGKE
ncbi:hypothetical protein M758_1G242000 [Ceratodon purpureus]|nr:hypothetical protein M758_1G242000 [Ceratodon purpureus]